MIFEVSDVFLLNLSEIATLRASNNVNQCSMFLRRYGELMTVCKLRVCFHVNGKSQGRLSVIVIVLSTAAIPNRF